MDTLFTLTGGKKTLFVDVVMLLSATFRRQQWVNENFSENSCRDLNKPWTDNKQTDKRANEWMNDDDKVQVVKCNIT